MDLEDCKKIYLIGLCGLRLDEISKRYAKSEIDDETYQHEKSMINYIKESLFKKEK